MHLQHYVRTVHEFILLFCVLFRAVREEGGGGGGGRKTDCGQ